jgi:hypothetical protein
LPETADALSKRKDYRQIVIQKGEMVVSLNRAGPTTTTNRRLFCIDDPNITNEQ